MIDWFWWKISRWCFKGLPKFLDGVDKHYYKGRMTDNFNEDEDTCRSNNTVSGFVKSIPRKIIISDNDRIQRTAYARAALSGLLANPERYKYITDKVKSGELTQDQATEKNVNKAFMIADAMVKREGLDTFNEDKTIKAEASSELTNLFKLGTFTAASGKTLHWKIECDALTDADWQCLAQMIVEKVEPFGAVEGVPTGGAKLAKHLQPHCIKDLPLLIVDDVYTTGGSMEKHRAGRDAIGVVVFARNPITQDWIKPLFRMG